MQFKDLFGLNILFSYKMEKLKKIDHLDKSVTAIFTLYFWVLFISLASSIYVDVRGM